MTSVDVPDLSVVVVSYNTRDLTLACLRSVAAQDDGLSTEVLVVDNASADGSAEAVRDAGLAGVSVVETGGNLGFARAVQRGVAAARGRYVVLLNPDTVVLPGSLGALHRFAEAHPHHGLYGGRTLRPDGSLDPSSCWGAPSLWSLLCFATGLSTAFRRSWLLDPESLGRWERDTVREVPVITGCLLLARREVLVELGGMDPVYFLYGEDAELSTRAWRAGYRPVVVPEAVIVHEVGASSGSAARKMPLVMAGRATYLHRLWPAPRARAGLALLAAGAGLRAALEQVAGRRSGTWTAVWRTRRAWLPGYPVAERELLR